MNSHELREAFLRFFEERDHRRISGAPIVPPGDPTLMFTSAGMVQFKPYFMGQSRPPHTRLATVQKCFRTTDIESVGDTSHLTFFEMLGNFSVGDYFKAEIIPWAWEFYTQVLKLTPDRLWPAVYLDDDEAYDIWVKIGVPKERIKRYGEEHNYWFSGDTGPCGPDSEIYYDFGERFGCGPECEPAHDCGRFLEIWNLVFMSFYCDGEKRTPLPSKNVDTGAGLERNACALLFESEAWPDKSKLPTVYDTDLFQPIVREIEHLYSVRYGESQSRDRSIRIIAEHVRAACFLIADGITPSNEGRGYVLRRMLRRAIYHAHSLIGNVNYLDMLVPAIVELMYGAYPELRENAGSIVRWIKNEESRFTETLGRGRIAIKAVADLKDYMKNFLEQVPIGRWAAQQSRLEDLWHSSELPEPVKLAVLRPISEVLGSEPWLASKEAMTLARASGIKINGEAEFILWDTYGFPRELTREIAESVGLEFAADADQEFQGLMERQQRRSRVDATLKAEVATATARALPAEILAVDEVRFTGYEELSTETRVGAITVDMKRRPNREELAKVARKEARSGEVAEVILDSTPFYPEGGGQVGDRGEIVGANGRAIVEDTQRVGRLIVHRGRVVEGQIAVGDEVTARVDAGHRADTMRNHTATHLLHAALRKVLGPHARQAGSLVAPDHLRFDFTHTEAVTREQLAEVERLVNEKVRQNLPVHTRQTTFDQAMSEGVLAFFGDKYGEEVRVVEVNTVVPRFSAELCGGTHCERTGDIGLVIITGESSIGSGMRRIEALSGRGAEGYARQQLGEIEEVLQRLGGARGALLSRLDALVSQRDALQKRVERMERSLAAGGGMDQITDGAVEVDGVKVLASLVDLPSIDALRYRVDGLRKTMPSGVVVLGTVIDGRPQFVAVVSADVIPKGPKAGEILKRVAAVAGGGGGGRPEMAQGGGKDPSKIEAALAVVPEAVREMLSSNGPSGEG